MKRLSMKSLMSFVQARDDLCINNGLFSDISIGSARKYIDEQKKSNTVRAINCDVNKITEWFAQNRFELRNQKKFLLMNSVIC